MGKKEIEKTLEIIKKFKEKYRNKFKIDQIIIFGSYAKGKIKENSDIDMIIVSKKYSSKDLFSITPKLYLILHQEMKIKRPIDILLYSKVEFEREKNRISIVSEALRKCIVI